MKKRILILVIAIAAVAALGLTAFSFAQAAAPQGFGPGRGEAPFMHNRGGDHPLEPYIEEVLADILGVSTEELQDAKAERGGMADLLDAAGLTPEEVRTAIQEAMPDIVAQALEDGAIDEAQAERILSFEFDRPFGPRHGFGPLAPYVQEVTADVLGMDVEDLQAALEDGQKLGDLIQEAGVTPLELQMAIDEATPDIVAQALEDGVIDETQAEALLANGLRHGGCRDRGGFGPRR